MKNGRVFTGDFLIAADGSRSDVRRCLLPDEKLNFVRIVGMCL